MRSAYLAFCYLAKIIDGEDDSVTVEMERNLPAVSTRPKSALSNVFEADAAQDLGRLYRRENLRKADELPSSHLPVLCGHNIPRFDSLGTSPSYGLHGVGVHTLSAGGPQESSHLVLRPRPSTRLPVNDYKCQDLNS